MATFEPPISEWTDQQLDDSLEHYIKSIADFIQSFGVDVIWIPMYQEIIENIKTEIIERQLLKS